MEKSDRLGGTINFTDHDPYKVDYKNYKDLLIRRVADRKVKVRFNTEVTAELLDEVKPDVIIAAVGAAPKTPAIPGIHHAVHALDAYQPGFAPRGNVVVVGGGNHAAETGVYLAACEGVRHVTILRANFDGITDGKAVNIIRRKMTQDGITYVEDEKLLSIEPDRVVTEQNSYPADTIVYCLGMEARTDTVRQLETLASGIPVHAVGDCKAPREVANAIRAAYVAAMRIC